jgi:hypothetical protein
MPAQACRCTRGVGFGTAAGEDPVEAVEGAGEPLARQVDAHALRLPRRQLENAVRRDLGAVALRVHRLAPSGDHRFVDAVLERARRRGAPELRRVALVLAVEELGVRLDVPEHRPELGVLGGDDGFVARESRLLHAVAPAPDVAEEELRQDVDPGRLRTPVGHVVGDEEILRRRLRDEHVDVEVAPFVEHSAIGQLELGLASRAAAVLLDEPRVGKFGLRILVEELEPRVRRRRVEIPVELLDVLAVIALRTGEAEEPLLEVRVPFVPERQRQAEELAVVGQAGEAVLAPAVGARPRRFVGEIVPGRAVGGVVLAHRPPLPFREVSAPAPPGSCALLGLPQSLPFRIHVRSLAHHDSCTRRFDATAGRRFPPGEAAARAAAFPRSAPPERRPAARSPAQGAPSDRDSPPRAASRCGAKPRARVGRR